MPQRTTPLFACLPKFRRTATDRRQLEFFSLSCARTTRGEQDSRGGSYVPNSAPVDIVDNPKSARNEEPDRRLTGAGEMSENVRLTEERIDEVIATCDNDLRGAIKALLLINERLEAELEHLHEQLLAPPLQPTVH